MNIIIETSEINTPTDTTEPARPPFKVRVEQAQTLLRERYPDLFGDHPKPLKIGIHRDLLERHPDHYKLYVQNYIRQFGVRKVEANALVVAPKAARALCSAAIEKYLGVDIDAAVEEFDSRLEFPRREVRRMFAESLS